MFESHFHVKGIEGKVMPKTKVEGRQGERYGTKRTLAWRNGVI